MQRILFVFLLWSILCSGWVGAQPKPTPKPKDTATPTASATPETPTPTPVTVDPTPVISGTPIISNAIPLTEISSRSEATVARLRELDGELRDDSLLFTLRSSLPALTEEMDLRLREDTRLLQAHPDIDSLRNMELRWRALAEPLPGWKQGLNARVTRLDQELGELTNTTQSWQDVIAPANAAQLAPEDLATARELLTSIDTMSGKIAERRKLMNSLRSTVDRQMTRFDQAINALQDAREHSVSQMLSQDSPPLHSKDFLSRLGPSMVKDVVASLYSQSEALLTYLGRQAGKLLGPIFIFLVIGLILDRIHKALEREGHDDPDFKKALTVFETPYLTAATLTVMFGRALDPAAPRMLSAILGALIIIPTVLLLRRLVERQLWPLLNVLLGFFIMDQLRVLTAPVPLVVRILLVIECILALVFLFWFRSKVNDAPREAQVAAQTRRNMSALLWFATAVAAGSVLVNMFGFVALAKYLLDGLLGAIYLGVIFYGFLKLLEGLSFWLIRTRALAKLNMIRRHGRVIRRRALRAIRVLLVIGWIISLLDLMALSKPAGLALVGFLSYPLGIGALKFSLGSILGFFFIVWSAMQISRFLRFGLEQDVYPHLRLNRGVPYALSMAVHYVVLIIGISMALTALGVDTTKFTMVAGALSVGIGFGLQNIVNNFVSGLILLVDRPVNVGDNIKLGEHSGKLRRIGLRSSTLVVGDGSEVIIPNSDLINQRVVNWSQAGLARRCELTLQVPQELNLGETIERIRELVLSCEGIAGNPAPNVLVTGYSGRLTQLLVQAWVADQGQLASVRSRLATHLRDGLGGDGIQVSQPK